VTLPAKYCTTLKCQKTFVAACRDESFLTFRVGGIQDLWDGSAHVQRSSEM
jgi:hypothetical protein